MVHRPARTVAMALVATLSACGSGGADPRPDVFLLTVDTLRADHLPTYGYEWDTAPWLDDVANRGVVFERATATSSWTVPSVAGYLTGMLPHQLGVGDVPSKPTVSSEVNRIPDAAITLAERLSAAGYRTLAVTANAHLTAEMGYAQGFESYVNVGFAPAEDVTDALKGLDATSGDRPRFVWIHLFDPHDPYAPREPWLRERLATAPGGAQATVDAIGRLPMRGLTARPDLAVEGPALEVARALYDSEIRHADEALQKIADSLQIGSDDVVVFASDHGEEFREHGNLGHRLTLYEETLRVPLVISAPSRFQARRIPDRVSLASLVPTIAELAGVPVGPSSGVSTASLVPLLEGRPRTDSPAIVADLKRQNGPRFLAIYDGDTKLIVPDEGPAELYDLTADPGEHDDQADAKPGRVTVLRRELNARLAYAPALAYQPIVPDVSPELLEQLHAMGYVDDAPPAEQQAPEPTEADPQTPP